MLLRRRDQHLEFWSGDHQPLDRGIHGVRVQRDRHQRVQTVSLAYNFLGHTRFGAVEWRTEDAGSR